MAAAIREAENYVHVEFYILSYDHTTHDVWATGHLVCLLGLFSVVLAL